MPQTEETQRIDAEKGKEKVKQGQRYGGSVTIPLTGFIEEGKFYGVRKDKDGIIIIRPMG